MSCVLIYSPNCSKCSELIQYINSNAQFKALCKYHNINTQGIPPNYQNKIKFVPTMLTSNGKLLVGKEIKNWLTSLLPNEQITNLCLNGSCGLSNLDGSDENDSIFALDSYGQSLQPAMTPELQQRINGNVTDTYNNLKR